MEPKLKYYIHNEIDLLSPLVIAGMGNEQANKQKTESKEKL